MSHEIKLMLCTLIALNLITLGSVLMSNDIAQTRFEATRAENAVLTETLAAIEKEQNLNAVTMFNAFANVFDALTHIHNEEVRPMYEAMEPVIKGVPLDEVTRSTPEKEAELEVRISTTAN